MVNGPSDLSPEDRLHLHAAEGWAALGNLVEARVELERITKTGQAQAFSAAGGAFIGIGGIMPSRLSNYW